VNKIRCYHISHRNVLLRPCLLNGGKRCERKEILVTLNGILVGHLYCYTNHVIIKPALRVVLFETFGKFVFPVLRAIK
jgi:hypothetical protein